MAQVRRGALQDDIPNAFSGWFRASASRIRGGWVARLQMQTKLFAAGLINVNHRPIVDEAPIEKFRMDHHPSDPREKPRGWLTATRPLSTPADGWIYVCAQSRPSPSTWQFSRSFSPPSPLCRADFFLPSLPPSPLAGKRWARRIREGRGWTRFWTPFSRLFFLFLLFLFWERGIKRSPLFAVIVWRSLEVVAWIEWIGRDLFLVLHLSGGVTLILLHHC